MYECESVRVRVCVCVWERERERSFMAFVGYKSLPELSLSASVEVWNELITTTPSRSETDFLVCLLY